MRLILFLVFCAVTTQGAIVFPKVQSASYDADALDYFTRVEATGSSISTTQKTAVNTFVLTAKSHGYWTNLIDCSPFAGNSLTGALVKLRYPSYAPSSAIATGMVASNYSESIGFLGAPSKYMDTGINFTNLGTNVGGLSMFLNRDVTRPALSLFLGGSITAPTAYLEFIGGAGGFSASYGAQVSSISQPTYGHGLYHIYRETTNRQVMFIAGRPITTNTTPVTTVTNSNYRMTVLAGNTSFPDTNFWSWYAIDDGRIAGSQASNYWSDVNRLVTQMGRRTISEWSQPYVPIYGQSLSVGTSSGTALTTNQPFLCRMPTRGPVGVNGIFVQGNFPLLTEVQIETIASGFANTVAFQSRTNSIIATNDPTTACYGVSGAGYVSLKQGTAAYTNLTNRVAEALALSPDYYMAFHVPGVAIVHGESDCNSATYQSDIETWQTNLQSDIQAISGQTNSVPLFHSQISSWSAATLCNSATNRSPYAALAAYEANPMKTVMVCPKYFFTYVTDGVHLTNWTYRWLGEYYGKAYYRVVVEGQRWYPLYPTNISRSGVNIDSVYPTTNSLAWDIVSVTECANMGFEVFTNGVAAGIASVAFVAPTSGPTNTVRVTLVTDPGVSSVELAYAFTATNSTGASPIHGPRGNLKRPETQFLSLYGNNLDDWCVHFRKSVP